MGVGGNIVGQSGCQESIHDSGHYSNNYIEHFSEIMFSAIRQKLKWCVLWNHMNTRHAELHFM